MRVKEVLAMAAWVVDFSFGIMPPFRDSCRFRHQLAHQTGIARSEFMSAVADHRSGYGHPFDFTPAYA